MLIIIIYVRLSQFTELQYLVGNQLGPNNLGGSVEGELHGERGELQLLDGVGLPRFDVYGLTTKT